MYILHEMQLLEVHVLLFLEITAANKANVCTYAVTKDELDQPVCIPFF